MRIAQFRSNDRIPEGSAHSLPFAGETRDFIREGQALGWRSRLSALLFAKWENLRFEP
jgi:hypothetical protein